MADETHTELTALTADVVAAYVANNKVTAEEVGTLITATYAALKSAGDPAPSEPEMAMPDKAAIKKSQHLDHLTSFIDGKKYKSLKRHLSTHDMTPADYRKRYGLPSDYPMVAPSYSAQRSELAKSLGLGRKATTDKAPASAAQTKKLGAERKEASTPTNGLAA